jgi:hypothetical protein
LGILQIVEGGWPQVDEFGFGLASFREIVAPQLGDQLFGDVLVARWGLFGGRAVGR